MRVYRIEITGTTPLLMHADDIDWADRMEAWKNDPANKKVSRAGDDRSPAFRWIGSLYHDGQQLVIPTENIMRALMEGGTMVLVPGGRSGKTFKAQTQSGIMPRSLGWPLLVNGRPVGMAGIGELMAVNEFSTHRERVAQMGFSLFNKRARIGQAKHVRVRPRFDDWRATGELVVTDEQITTGVLRSILNAAGRYKGLGDWRPGGRTPGIYGMFEATATEI